MDTEQYVHGLRVRPAVPLRRPERELARPMLVRGPDGDFDVPQDPRTLAVPGNGGK
jgi:hypothetical protein